MKRVVVGRVCRSVVLASVLVLGGCMQTTTGNLAQPPAAGNPLVLNSAPQTPDGVPDPNAGPAAATAASGGPAASTPEPIPATAAPAATEPLAVAAPDRQTAPVAAPASATISSAKTENGYPNINVTPAQPGGVLLPPDERKRIISELEALRAGQGESPSSGGGTSALSSEAETHGERALQQIEKCSEKGAAKKYPECAPTN
ncbi:MAG: hypothetical protein GY798_22720 [Hyphomicrobiales bacterium]|nr:hypothetical protein [Hyphomicrobiales bacterium]